MVWSLALMVSVAGLMVKVVLAEPE